VVKSEILCLRLQWLSKYTFKYRRYGGHLVGPGCSPIRVIIFMYSTFRRILGARTVD
jgi:hypothetical protein